MLQSNGRGENHVHCSEQLRGRLCENILDGDSRKICVWGGGCVCEFIHKLKGFI